MQDRIGHMLEATPLIVGGTSQQKIDSCRILLLTVEAPGLGNLEG